MEAAASPARARAILKEGGVPLVRPDVFVQLSADEQAAILQKIPVDRAWSLLRDSDSRSIAAGVERFGFDKAGPILRELPPDDLAELAIRFSDEARVKLLDAVGPEVAAEVRRLLEYPEDTAGRMMSPRYVSVPEVVSVARALEMIRDYAKSDSISYVYVVDTKGRLVGTIPIRALLVAQARTPVGDAATRNVVLITAKTPRDEVVRTFRQHHYMALPVVDDQARIIGVITADDVLSQAKEQEDNLVFSAVGARGDEAAMQTARAARSRLPWMTVTILGGIGCAVVGGLFQGLLERLAVLGIFIPLVLAIAESIAAQTSTLVMKTLVTGMLPRRQMRAFLVKELSIGLIVGVYAGLLVGGVSMLWHKTPQLGLAIGLAIVASVCTAATFGVVVPLVLRRFRVEPSVAGGPLALTLTDLATLAVYFGSALLLA